jgi:hypothetical protein
MELGIDYVDLVCTLSGNDPPKPGQTYVDEAGTEWVVRTEGVYCRGGLLSDTPIWAVKIGASNGLRGPIPPRLKLERVFSASEIRTARQQLQSLGVERVIFDEERKELVVEECDTDIAPILPKSVDGIPVSVP